MVLIAVLAIAIANISIIPSILLLYMCSIYEGAVAERNSDIILTWGHGLGENSFFLIQKGTIV